MTTANLDLMVLRAELAAIEQELERADDLGDAAAVVRVRRLRGPRLAQIRIAITEAERLSPERKTQ